MARAVARRSRAGIGWFCLSVLVGGTFVESGVSAGLAQQPPARAAFEVASVRRQEARIPPAPGAPRPAVVAQFDRTNATLLSLIQFAYGVRPDEIVGGPDWIRSDLFQISARAAEPVSPDVMALMVQSLLADRFRLVVRREPRAMRHHELVRERPDRLGPRLTACSDDEALAPPPPAAPMRMPLNAAPGPISARCGTLANVVSSAAMRLRTPVVDKTGLSGKWSYSFFVADPNPMPAPRGLVEAEPALPFEDALREYLGLRLVEANGPVDVLVVDSASLPSEN